LLPKKARLKSSEFHRETNVVESTFLVDFANAEAVQEFEQKVQNEPSVSNYHLLSPEDSVLG
jgi:hypothetical protein